MQFKHKHFFSASLASVMIIHHRGKPEKITKWSTIVYTISIIACRIYLQSSLLSNLAMVAFGMVSNREQSTKSPSGSVADIIVSISTPTVTLMETGAWVMFGAKLAAMICGGRDGTYKTRGQLLNGIFFFFSVGSAIDIFSNVSRLLVM